LGNRMGAIKTSDDKQYTIDRLEQPKIFKKYFFHPTCLHHSINKPTTLIF
jgi:hypothetical protein